MDVVAANGSPYVCVSDRYAARLELTKVSYSFPPVSWEEWSPQSQGVRARQLHCSSVSRTWCRCLLSTHSSMPKAFAPQITRRLLSPDPDHLTFPGAANDAATLLLKKNPMSAWTCPCPYPAQKPASRLAPALASSVAPDHFLLVSPWHLPWSSWSVTWVMAQDSQPMAFHAHLFCLQVIHMLG